MATSESQATGNQNATNATLFDALTFTENVSSSIPVDGAIVSTDGWSSLPVRPWRRYFARSFDILVNGVIGFWLVGLAFYSFAPISADKFFSMFEGPGGRIIDPVLTLMIAMPINAVMIGLTGSTFGKWIFGVRVIDSSMFPIGIPRAFWREIHVWFTGQAIGIPVLLLITTYMAKNGLQKIGTTAWDKGSKSVVIHRPPSSKQDLLIFFAILIFIGILVLFKYLELNNGMKGID